MVKRPGTMMIEAIEIAQIVMGKSQIAKGASHHPNCLTLIQTCWPYLPRKGIAIGRFEVVCRARDAVVIGRVGVLYCDKPKLKV